MSYKLFFQQLGFSPEEIEVYLFLLENRSKNLEELTKELSFSSLKIAAIIDELLRKKAINSLQKNQVNVFSATKPESLINAIEQEQKKQRRALEELRRAKGELEGIMNDEKPVVRFFEGADQIASVMKSRQEEGEVEMKVFFPTKEVDAFFKKAELHSIIDSAQNRYKDIQSICTEPPTKNKIVSSVRRYLAKPENSFSCAVEIWNNKVHIVSLQKNPCGVLIEQEDIAKTFSMIFEMALAATNKIEEEK